MKKAGFTLWELLAVLIIILFVAVLLFPVFAKVHEKNPHGTCASNEKQIGLALLQYVQDNDDQIPDIASAKDPKITWRTMIYPYAKSIGMFLCPSRDEKLSSSEEKFNTLDGFPISYAANYTGDYSGHKNDTGNGAFAGAGSKPVALEDIQHPEALIVLCEVWHTSSADFNIDNLGAFNPRTDSLWAGHSEGSNYLLADGHVKYWKPLDTQTLWHRDASIPLSAGSVKVLQNAHKGEGR